MSNEDTFTGRYERRDEVKKTKAQELGDNGWRYDGASWQHEDYKPGALTVGVAWHLHLFGIAQRQKGFEDGLEEGIEAARDGAI